jgi:histidine triad (HIT) family protein
MACIFCKIVFGEMPSYKIYEDESTLAFLDIAPVNPGHVLVIPKKHFSNLEEIPEEEFSKLAVAVKKVAVAVTEATEATGHNVNINNGETAGQVIFHLHFHIIPRRDGDGFKLWPQGSYESGEAEKMAGKIRKILK